MARIPRTENNVEAISPDLPTNICFHCGSRVWNIQLTFTDDYEIGWYNVDGECANCGARATVVTPPDHPDHPQYGEI